MVSTDYTFMKKEELGMPILTFKCRKSKGVFAYLVPQKGATGYAIKRSSEVFKYLGHNKVIYRSDQEPAILDLKDRVKNEVSLFTEVVLESTPVGDSQANGAIENANQYIKAQIKTMFASLQDRYKREIPEDHNCMAWLITHAAACINRYSIGEDGKTAYQRIRMKRFRRDVAEFGECIWYLRANSKDEKSLRSRWHNGIFLGIIDRSNEILVGTDKGVIKCISFIRKGSYGERWNWEQFSKFVGTPWEKA